jgi:ABC-type bacteriocin/lantibiotic exporter with double-glycine peptidase domain
LTGALSRMTKRLSPQLRWFLFQLRPLLQAHLLSVLLIVLASLTFLLDPLILKWLIDIVLPKRDARLLMVAVACIAGVYICQLSCYAAGGVISFQTVQKLVFSIRLKLLEQINRLSADFHETVPLGEKLYRIEQDVDQLAELGSTVVPSILQTTFTAIFVLSTMFVLNLRLTCVLLPLMPLFVFLKRQYETRLRRAADSAQEESSKENNFLQEHLSSVVQIQLLCQEETQTRAFISRARAKMEALRRRNIQEILFRTWFLGVVAIGMIAILSYGGYQVFLGALTVGGFVAFYSYLARLFAPLSAAVDIYSRLNRLNSSLRRILKIIDEKPSVRESPTAVDLPRRTQAGVILEGVYFGYRDNPHVLTGLDLELRTGEKIALVGSSGSGKSTVAKLIARLYDVNQGVVRIDGIDVRDATLASLRSTVCYVPQEAILFDRSIKENLLLGKADASIEELWDAVEVAGLTALIHSLPRGWDTPVGPRGTFFSGGERQRLALARAVLQNPSVFLLDESTSALDVPSERQVYVNLTQHFAEQTILFVSHRVSALTWTDRVVVLHQGLIEEQGTHDQLIERGRLYPYLYRTASSSDGSALLYSPSDKRSSPLSGAADHKKSRKG